MPLTLSLTNPTIFPTLTGHLLHRHPIRSCSLAMWSPEMGREVQKCQPLPLLPRDCESELYGPNGFIRYLPADPKSDLSAPLHPDLISGLGLSGVTITPSKKKKKIQQSSLREKFNAIDQTSSRHEWLLFLFLSFCFPIQRLQHIENAEKASLSD